MADSLSHGHRTIGCSDDGAELGRCHLHLEAGLVALLRPGKGYVLGTHANQPSNSWINIPRIAGTAEQIAQNLAPSTWQRLSAGEDTKGPQLFDWAYLELADIEGEQYGAKGTWTRGLLVRRSIADGERAFFSTWCPVGTNIGVLVTIEGHR